MARDLIFSPDFGSMLACESVGGTLRFCDVLTRNFTFLAATANQNMLAAVTGKICRIVSIIGTSAGAQTAARIHTSGGGSNHMFITIPANGAATPNADYGFNPFGWVNSDVGGLLQVDTGAVACDLSVTYYYFTPGVN